LTALSIGWRSTVSKTRDGAPLANAKPLPPGCEDALYEVAAYPDACHARGVGEGDGEGDAAAPGDALGAGIGFVCAIAGTVVRAQAAVKAAIEFRKEPP
jgi:hypothetical protein